MKFEPVSVLSPCVTEEESDDALAWIHAGLIGERRFQVTGTTTKLPALVVIVTVYLYDSGGIVVGLSILTLTTWAPLLSRFPLFGKTSSDVSLSSDSVQVSFAPQLVRATSSAAGGSFPHTLVKVSDGGLALHIDEDDDKTVSVTLTSAVAVAPALVVILNGIVAVYVPVLRLLLSTVTKTSVFSPACKPPLADLTPSQFAPLYVTNGAGTDQEPVSPQLVILSV
jgi:hypothetical protein